MKPSTYAVIGRDRVTVSNIVIADQDFIDANYPGAVMIDGISPLPGIGWRWNPVSKTFSKPVTI